MLNRAHQSCLEGEAAEAVGEIPPSLNTWSDHQYTLSLQMQCGKLPSPTLQTGACLAEYRIHLEIHP